MSTKVKSSGIDSNIVLQNPTVSTSLREDGNAYASPVTLASSATITPDSV